MNPFKHRFPIQIRFKDADMMGHVNNANYFTYAESARLNYLDQVVGTGTDWQFQRGLILARFEIDYKEAIKYNDKIYVYTRCSRLGTKSFDLIWLITKENEHAEVPVAEGKAVIVCYDYEMKKSMSIPEDRKKIIAKFEGIEIA